MGLLYASLPPPPLPSGGTRVRSPASASGHSVTPVAGSGRARRSERSSLRVSVAQAASGTKDAPRDGRRSGLAERREQEVDARQMMRPLSRLLLDCERSSDLKKRLDRS
jgi:hypothetical protein